MLSHQLKKTNEIIIPCELKKYSIKKQCVKNNEYSLKTSMFDPSKNSPPNYFMINLQKRMKIYSEK
jgi:hypothetical protein